MNRYQKLMQRIHDGDRVLIDGATGTEVERRGVPQLENAWNGGAALSHPDVLRQVHEDYLRHGAEIVISNTFANSHHAMCDAGIGEQFESYNRRGVELAIEARENTLTPDVLVAGGISYWSWTGKHPSLEALRASVTKQASVMADASADLLMLEMMIDIDRTLVTLDAAQSSGLPVWVGLTCEPNADDIICLRNGETLVDALAPLAERDVPLVSIMHTEVEDIDACLDVMQAHWTGPSGVYAHTGRFSGPNAAFTFSHTISPEDYASACKCWLDIGVQVIGGCCGIGPDHIERLGKAV